MGNRAMTMSRRGLWLGAAGAIAAPNLARAQPRRWRMLTSWVRNLPGPGVSAERLARRITAMTDGALTVDVFAAGEIVPAFSVLDAVSNGTAEMGHTAALFWAGKLAAAPIFTTVPFGLGPAAHAGWLDAEGQALWDRLYAPLRVKPLLAGNTGPSTAGWFRRPIAGLNDIAPLRIRVAGLGAELYRRMGATPLTLAPGDTYPALERGAIDAAEFLAPANDAPLGLHRIAPHLGYPGFNKPNGPSELVIGLDAWDGLTPALRAAVTAAARAEHDQGLAEAAAANARALPELLAAGVRPFRLPDAVLGRAREITAALLDEIAARDPLSGAIVASHRSFASDAMRAWDRLSRL
jgi:TRAP-type mannitol/chloroaromatic compound transport system substrate-binding protein